MKFMINEGVDMDRKFVEENGIYQIDCSKAVWATDERLPFELQNSAGMGKILIEKVEVLSIEEWNAHEKYGIFPITQVAVI